MLETATPRPARRRRRRLLKSLCLLLVATGLTAAYLAGGDYVSFWPVFGADRAVTASIDEAELSAHVHYFAHPALKGRLPFSMGSRKARAYIVDRFRACQLKPWGDAEGFQQPFSIGTNVVGMLPGSDPDLANEFILLTAHHDHLGKGKLGACDNASGIAALLEVAESLSQSPNKPRRSVAFAVFDCEEIGLIGAYAFSSRPDYTRARVRAVLNADMLGRHFLDLLDNTVIVSGGEFYPETRGRMFEAGRSLGLEPHAAGLDLAGMRGDHAAFLSPREEIPEPPLTLFFSCGSFDGYHSEGDTADRIDYPLLTRSARFLGESARLLADADAIEARAELEAPDRAELALFKAVGDELLRQGAAVGLTDTDRKACTWWLDQAEGFATGPAYTFENRRYLTQYLATLGPPVRKLLAEAMGTGKGSYPSSEDILSSVGAAEIWMRYGPVFDEGYRRFVNMVLQRNLWTLALHGLPDPYYPYSTPCITEDDIVLQDLGDGRLRLSFFEPDVSVYSVLQRFGSAGVFFHVNGYALKREGTRDELIDMALLQWSAALPTQAEVDRVLKNRTEDVPVEDIMRWARERLSPRRVAGIHAGHRRILETLTGEPHGATLDDWLSWRTRELGYPSRKAWVLALIDRDSPAVSLSALGELVRTRTEDREARVCEVCSRILSDPRKRAEFGTAIVRWLRQEGGEAGLQRLVDCLADETVLEPWTDPTLDESNPMHDHPVVRYGKTETDWNIEKKDPPRDPNAKYTLADVALYELKEATGEDFGKDMVAWLDLIERGFEPPPEPEGCGCGSDHPASHTPIFYSWSMDQ